MIEGIGRRIAGLCIAAFFALVAMAVQASEDVAVIVAGETEHTFTIEIADTPEATSRGLMFRRTLAPDAGMLFDFFNERPASFWMRNTLIPLDMLFIRANGEIVRVHENAIPHDETPIPSGAPVRFVLEIPGGRAAELGIGAGDVFVHPRVKSD